MTAAEQGAAVDGPNVADVVAAHRFSEYDPVCSCGWTPTKAEVRAWCRGREQWTVGIDWQAERRSRYEAHVAAALQPVIDAEVSRQVAAREADAVRQVAAVRALHEVLDLTSHFPDATELHDLCRHCGNRYPCWRSAQ